MYQIKDTLDIKNRNTLPYSNEFRLYKARAYANCEEGDDRIQVRVLPYMSMISPTELDNLPKYAPLIKGSVPKVNTEKDDQIGDLLWVIAIPDFTIGYVLGPANVINTAGDDKPLSHWDFSGAKEVLKVCNGITDDFEYKNIMVDMQNTTGTLIEFHNIKSGEKWIINSTGDMIHMRPGQIVLQSAAGVGQDDVRSKIIISPEKVQVNTSLFEVNAKNVLLGKHNMHLLATLAGPYSSISCDGVNLQPIKNIMV